MENMIIKLAWFAAASAKYLDIGLDVEQRIGLYLEGFEVAKKNSDLRLLFICNVALLSLTMDSTIIDPKTSEEESVDDEAKMAKYVLLGNAHMMKKQYDDAIPCYEKLLGIAQESSNKGAEMNAYITLGAAHLKKQEYNDAIFYCEKGLAISRESCNELAEMNAYMVLGEAHLKKQEYNDALSYSEKSCALAQKSGYKVGEVNSYIMLWSANIGKKEKDVDILYVEKSLASARESGNEVTSTEMIAYLMIGNEHLRKKEYGNAILYVEKSLAISRESGNEVFEMTAYMMLGCAYLKKEEHDNAIFYSKKCLAVAQEYGHKMVEASAYMKLGDAFLEKGDYDVAIPYIEKGLAIAQKSGDKEAEVNACMKLGDAFLKIGECDNAIFYSKKCLTIAQKSGHKNVEANACRTLGDTLLEKEKFIPDAEVNAYVTLGNAFNKKGEYDAGILYGNKCLAIAQEFGDKVTEANAYIILGDAYFFKKRYDDAILYSKKYLAIAQEFGYKEAEMKAYMALGNANLGKDKYADAISYSQKHLTLALESGDKMAEADAYSTLGFAYRCNEQYDEAHTYFTKAINMEDTMDRALFKLTTRIGLDAVHRQVGILKGNIDYVTLKSVYEEFEACIGIGQEKNMFMLHCVVSFSQCITQGKYEQAILCLEEGMKTAAESHRGAGNTLSSRHLLCFKYLISEVHVVYGQYDKAIQCLKEVLNLAQVVGNKEYLAKCQFALGVIVYYYLEQTEMAEKLIKESFKYSEFIFDLLGRNDSFRIAFIDQYKLAYKILTKILIQRNKIEEALVFSDHYRAKVLKDLLLSSYGMKKDTVAKDSLQYSDVQSLVYSSNYTLLFYSLFLGECYTFLVQTANKLELSVHQFKNCDACLGKLVDKAFDDMKVFQVDNCEDRSLDFIHGFEENPKENALTKLFSRLSEQCLCMACGNPSENIDENSLENGLEILYDKLIHKIRSSLIRQDDLVIIPEGLLYKVPFSALRDPDTGQYLSETKRIRMAPSITTLKFLQECPEEHHSSTGVLIVGGPLVGRVMIDGREEDVGFLEGALDEALDIASILGVGPLLAADATKPSVLGKLHQGVSVVHIAAHGSLSKATILLAPSPEIKETKIPDEEDYMLTMAEVQAAQVRAQLVVLSCCHSGRGEIKAEGVVGMCRAFLASGARAVVGSLWAVDDNATREFMVKFYTYLKDGKSASTSLQLTMNDMRRTPQYNEPKYWAPFFLMGDDVTIQLE